jgi:hypothetical protein
MKIEGKIQKESPPKERSQVLTFDILRKILSR